MLNTNRIIRSHLICSLFFFFNDTATTEIYTLSLHDALPIFLPALHAVHSGNPRNGCRPWWRARRRGRGRPPFPRPWRSEEHTSELQSRLHLVCRLLLEKKKQNPQAARQPPRPRPRRVLYHHH